MEKARYEIAFSATLLIQVIRMSAKMTCNIVPAVTILCFGAQGS